MFNKPLSIKEILVIAKKENKKYLKIINKTYYAKFLSLKDKQKCLKENNFEEKDDVIIIKIFNILNQAQAYKKISEYIFETRAQGGKKELSENYIKNIPSIYHKFEERDLLTKAISEQIQELSKHYKVK